MRPTTRRAAPSSRTAAGRLSGPAERVLDSALRAPSAGFSITVGYRPPDEPVPDRASVEARRRKKAEVVHRGQWGRH